MSNCERKVEAFESEFEYNPDWGGPDPVLWLHAGWQPNCGNQSAFDLSPWCQPPGTWAGSTKPRNGVTDRGRAWALVVANTDYCALPPNPAEGATEFAVSFWYNITAGYFDAASPIGDDLSATGGFAMRADTGTSKWEFYVGGVGIEWIVDGVRPSWTIDTDVWDHIVFGYDTKDFLVYRKGVLTDTLAAVDDKVVAPANNFRLGGGATNSAKYFGGQVSEVAIFRARPTAAMARLLYESSLDGSPGVMARPIGPRRFPTAVAGGYTVPLQLILECAQ